MQYDGCPRLIYEPIIFVHDHALKDVAEVMQVCLLCTIHGCRMWLYICRLILSYYLEC